MFSLVGGATGREAGRSKSFLLNDNHSALARASHRQELPSFMKLVSMFLEGGLFGFNLSEPKEWGQIEMGRDPEVLDELSNSRFALKHLDLRFLRESSGRRVCGFSISCPNLETLQLYLRRERNGVVAEPLSLSEGATLTGGLKRLVYVRSGTSCHGVQSQFGFEAS